MELRLLGKMISHLKSSQWKSWEKYIFLSGPCSSSGCPVSCGRDMKPYTHLSDKIWAREFHRLVFFGRNHNVQNLGRNTIFSAPVSIPHLGASHFFCYSLCLSNNSPAFLWKISSLKRVLRNVLGYLSINNFTEPNVSFIINHFKEKKSYLNQPSHHQFTISCHW